MGSGLNGLNAAIFLATIFTIFLTILIAGCIQPAEKPLQIKVYPTVGSYLPKYERFVTSYDKTNLLLLNLSLKVTEAERGYGSTMNRERPYKIMPGDRIIVIEGRVRNQDEEKEYVVLTARGYDPSGKEIAKSYGLGAPGTAPWMGDYFRLGYGEEGSFRLVLKYHENISTIRIFANLYETPVP